MKLSYVLHKLHLSFENTMSKLIFRQFAAHFTLAAGYLEFKYFQLSLKVIDNTVLLNCASWLVARFKVPVTTWEEHMCKIQAF
jgi:hypothetical protein